MHYDVQFQVNQISSMLSKPCDVPALSRLSRDPPRPNRPLGCVPPCEIMTSLISDVALPKRATRTFFEAFGPALNAILYKQRSDVRLAPMLMRPRRTRSLVA